MGYLYVGERGELWPRPAPVRIRGLTLLGCPLPPADPLRRLDRGARALGRKGCGRVLLQRELRGPQAEAALRRRGLAPIDPLPLCRAKGGSLALALVEQLPPRRRRVALRGERGETAWAAAAELCPRVGTLLLDFDAGEEALARRLRAVYGAAALHLGQGPAPQVSVEFSPRPGARAGTVLRLWGEPGLAGLTLTAGGEETDLPLLALLWETGRVEPDDIAVDRGVWP